MTDDSSEMDSLSAFFDTQPLEEKPKTKKRKPVTRRKKSKSPEESTGYDLIRAALESHLIDHAKKRQDQKRNVEQLSSIIEEYLSSFVLLGYNYDGEPITLVSASTQQQSDSLSTLIQKFIINSHGPGSGPSAI